MSSTMRRRNTDRSTSSRASSRSDDSHVSHISQSTAPTSIYSRPSFHHAATDRPTSGKPYFGANSVDEGHSPATTYYPRSSTETYASTIASQEDFYEEPEEIHEDFSVPEYCYKEVVEHDLRPSTPTDFAELFPSTRRLYIRHDDTTYDGNMNLRVDTESVSGSRKESVQLFHMRMHDLKAREFSLRRYCRDSGREVCHSSRKFGRPATERPGIQRSMSNALATIRGKPDLKRVNTGMSNHSAISHKSDKSVKKQDSGYGSDQDVFDEDDVTSFMEKKSKSSMSIPTNTTKLEFSNYAQVDVKRRGAQSKKRYEFEYWGYTYTWKRFIEKDGDGKAISYHLYKGDGAHAVAHIVPELRSPSEMRHEEAAGGWVPPCSMWISDDSVLEALTDVADVIIATGLVALIDDCIKRRFHPNSKHTRLPLAGVKVDMEFVGPRAMVEAMFKRRNSGASTKDKEGQKYPPLRTASHVEAR